MTESTLSLSYRDIQTEVGGFLGYGRTYTSWTSDQVSFVDAIIQTGLRNFYFPVRGFSDAPVHEWSFLKPVTTLDTVEDYDTGTVSSSSTTVTLSGGTWPSWTATNGTLVVDGTSHAIASRTDDADIELVSAPSSAFSGDSYELQHNGNYTMPDQFGGLCGSLTYDPTDNYQIEIDLTSEAKIRKKRQSTRITGKPQLAALRPTGDTPDATDGQRFELMLWPYPGGVYTLHYRYNLLVNALTADLHPWGGMIHSETILESCLAIAEQRGDDEIGLHNNLFKERLAASIEYDSRLMSSEKLGYNGNWDDNRLAYSRTNHVTYDGTLY